MPLFNTDLNFFRLLTSLGFSAENKSAILIALWEGEKSAYDLTQDFKEVKTWPPIKGYRNIPKWKEGRESGEVLFPLSWSL